MTAVSNAIPLILVARIGRLDLLGTLYAPVLVPPAVWRDVLNHAGR